MDVSYWNRVRARRLSRRHALVGASGLGAAAFLAACGGGKKEEARATTAPGTQAGAAPAAAQPQGKPGGTLRINLKSAEPTTGFDPHATFSFRTHIALSFTHDRVMEFKVGPDAGEADYTPVPGLAEKVETPDKTTFVITLRKGVKFHNKPPVNGRELTSADVKYTVERMIAKKFTYRDLFEGLVDKIETPDAATVRFTLVQPHADFLTNLANHYSWIVAREVDDQFGDMKKVEAVIGTGPFMLESYQPSVRAVWVKNPDFWIKGLPYLDRIEAVFVADEASNEAMVRQGQVEISTAILNPALDAMKASAPNLRWWHYISAGGPVFYYRNDKRPTNDVRVRRAIALGFDRQSWLKSFELGRGAIDNGPPILAAFKEWKLPTEQLGEGAQWYKYDVAVAKRLLAEAGYPNGFKAVMDAPNAASYGQRTVDEEELTKDFMSKIGIDLTINQKEYGNWLATGHAGIYDEFAYGPMTPYVSIDEWVYGMHHSKGGANKAHLKDPKLDELLEKQRAEYDLTARKQIVNEIQKYVANIVPYVWPPVGQTNVPYQPYVKGFRPKAGYNIGLVLRGTWIER